MAIDHQLRNVGRGKEETWTSGEKLTGEGMIVKLCSGPALSFNDDCERITS